jgi:hypothetical protein
MSREHKGYCRICRRYGDLSFEHIPPERAFNDKRQVFETIQNALRQTGRRKTIIQQGLGAYSLCAKCNNDTGSWYGGAFVDWSQQGFVWYEKLGGKSSLYLPFTIKPLNVIKQVLTMALAMSVDTPTNYYDEVAQFILNREQKYLPPRYKVHVYFNVQGQPRFESNLVVMNVEAMAASYIEAEVALPPFGYCITTPVRTITSLADNRGLYDITWFSRFDYNYQRDVHLRLPARETHEPFPLDYRTKNEIQTSR